MYKVRCYDRNGNLHHEEFKKTLEEAKKVRTEWGLSIGLRPEPSSDFGYYPTIWEVNDNGLCVRVEGY